MPDPLQRALVALDGLSVADAFARSLPSGDRGLPAAPWRWTYPTSMAVATVDVLKRRGGLQAEDLAATVARKQRTDPDRASPDEAVAARAAPIGAWFAGNLARVVEEALVSAEAGHRHPEETPGAVAVAVAAAMAFEGADSAALFDAVIARTPDGAVRSGLIAARALGPEAPMEPALGAVPFAIGCAARHLYDYEAALRAAGGSPSIAAVVGGIVACRVGRQGIPAAWLASREPLG